MAKDLEKFLKQAAERLADRVNESQGGRRKTQPAKNQPPRNVRQAERAPLEAEILDAEIVDAALDSDPISDIDTRHLDPKIGRRPALAQEISRADEKMASHVQHVTGGDVVHIRDASSALQGASRDGKTTVRRRRQSVNPLINMLRHPDSLRSAFIAGEIFNRRF